MMNQQLRLRPKIPGLRPLTHRLTVASVHSSYSHRRKRNIIFPATVVGRHRVARAPEFNLRAAKDSPPERSSFRITAILLSAPSSRSGTGLRSWGEIISS